MRALVIAALLMLGAASRGRAEEAPDPAIALVANDPAFEEALRDALVDRAVHTVGAVPTPTLANLASESRRLADASVAIATVWLSPASAGATLVTYDRESDRFLVRELAYSLPLSPTQAAEAARMVRTMLRALRADDEEAIVRSVDPNRITPHQRPVPPRFAAGLGVGAWFAAPKAYAAPQMTLAIAWRPYDLGAAVSATLAPAADIDTMSFRGDVRDIVIAAEARRAMRVAPTVHVTPGLGLALHVVSLAGAFDGGPRLTSRRYDPAARISALSTVTLPYGLDVGLAVSADCLLRRQTYEAGSERILSVPRVQLMMAGLVGVRF